MSGSENLDVRLFAKAFHEDPLLFGALDFRVFLSDFFAQLVVEFHGAARFCVLRVEEIKAVS